MHIEFLLKHIRKSSLKKSLLFDYASSILLHPIYNMGRCACPKSTYLWIMKQMAQFHLRYTNAFKTLKTMLNNKSCITTITYLVNEKQCSTQLADLSTSKWLQPWDPSQLEDSPFIPMQSLLKRGAHLHEGSKMPSLFGHAHTPLLKCMCLSTTN